MVSRLQRYKNALVEAESAKNALEECIADLELAGSKIALARIEGAVQARKEVYTKVIAKLDERWNCNCITDRSLDRTECECIESPAYPIRKLMEEEA